MFGVDTKFVGGPSPVQQELLSDQEQHNSNLSNRKEAPDGCLLHQVRSDPRSKVRTSQPQEDSLNDHVPLEDKKRTKHHERVNSSGGNPIGRFSHGYTPSQMILSTERTEFLSTKPFLSTALGVLAISSPIREVGQDVGTTAS